MQFNDTTTGQGLIQECEALTNLGATGISGNSQYLKDFTRWINGRLGLVVTMILNSSDSWDYDDINNTDFPILCTDLVEGQQDYSLPASEKILKVKRVEVTYDGSNWKRARLMDVNQNNDSASVDVNFSQASPMYDVQFNSVFLYPKPDVAVTKGLKLWVTRESTYFTSTDTTKEAGIDGNFQRMIAVGASLDFAVSKGLQNKNDLAFLWSDYEQRLRKHYGDKLQDSGITLLTYNENYK